MVNRRNALIVMLSLCAALVAACEDTGTTSSGRAPASCPGFDHGPAQGRPLDSGRGDLASAVRTFVSTIRGAESHDYRPPTEDERMGFATAWRQTVASPTSRSSLAAFGYGLFLYEDTGDESPGDGSDRWIVACEIRDRATGWERGWGLYLSNGPGRRTVVEVPHPRSDADAEDIAVAIARETGGDLLVAGAHRDANGEFDDDDCTQDDRCADMSHQDASVFQAVHHAIVNPAGCPGGSLHCTTGLVVVQPHGFATRLHQGIGDVAISDGTPDPLSPESVIDAVADDLERGGFGVCRFEAPRDCAGTTDEGRPGTSLGATKNVQGLSARDAVVPVDFIHVEASKEVRDRETGPLSRRRLGQIVGSVVRERPPG